MSEHKAVVDEVISEKIDAFNTVFKVSIDSAFLLGWLALVALRSVC
jgi:hypothetical protein